MQIPALLRRLAEVFDAPTPIEAAARDALRAAAPWASAHGPFTPTPLPPSFDAIMTRADAHPLCAEIAQMPLPWMPPRTSPSALYAAHSGFKVHVELLGPSGLVRSERVRLGLYGYAPHGEYGLRTHPAEEVFVMMAGHADWMRGNDGYKTLGPGGRSWHPSMMPHATRSGAEPFLSAYVWVGDLSTKNYVYGGLPAE